ncbi:Cerato-platanin-domain-containing protein [Suillus bovinus]|uniref:Cerato-platanin-domain-containing protein n=1 Tax=Suillus bovinus TaxID=48563 RepID=UPI001B869735|nr:Cerato-platanin-domain-containing protein [Suillus bovinus]KAG2155973.1 Cerato-platanin-domain-containing protein [Suillus bovinus]
MAPLAHGCRSAEGNENSTCGHVNQKSGTCCRHPAHMPRVEPVLASNPFPRRIKRVTILDVLHPKLLHNILIELLFHTMKFTIASALISVIALPAFAVPAYPANITANVTLPANVTYPAYVTYDPVYRNPNSSLVNVACSNGANGLLTKGYTTFGSIPSFPNIGGVPGATWNSWLCGTCWSLQYTTPGGNQTTIFITAVDAAYTFNISPQAFSNLTNSTSFEPGKVTANVTQVATINCGM